MLVISTEHPEDVNTYNITFTATLKDYKDYLDKIRINLPVQVFPCVVLDVEFIETLDP